MRKRPIIALSGGFDPLHVGHVKMIQAARAYGDVVIILNSDKWLVNKKGYVFMKWEQRAEILDSIEGVKLVLGVDDTDGTVNEILKKLRPDYFGNGGSIKAENVPEYAVCNKLGISMIYGLGGHADVESSTKLVYESLSDIVADKYKEELGLE